VEVEEEDLPKPLTWPGFPGSRITTKCDDCQAEVLLMEPPFPTACGTCGKEILVRVLDEE